MATVNFQCGNCHNLMAVGAEHIGQQVRCPHCQAVVVAPAAAPPAPLPQPAPFLPPTVSDHEDIFAPPEPSDDLFGQPTGPRVEMPPPAPTAVLDGANPDAPPSATMTYTPPAAPPAPAGDSTLPAWMEPVAPPAAAAPGSPLAVAPAGPADGLADHAALGAMPQLVRKPRDGGGLFIGLVFIPLVSYSILVTILAVYLFIVNQHNQQNTPQLYPLDQLPSFDPNDAEHSTHLKLDADPRKLNRVSGIDVALAESPLPDRLITRLGKKLRVGDLEVEPLRVTREKVSVDMAPAGDGPPFVSRLKPEPCYYDSLVLRMKLRNVSSNTAFQPMDVYFYRKWAPKSDQPPLTLLEFQKSGDPLRAFGGPGGYPPPARSASEGVKYVEWVHGVDYDRVLNPGEEMEAAVCTDGGMKEDDAEAKRVAEAIDKHHGKLLWRVHLRRGLVVRDAHHYAPASAVVGVEFTDEDYRKSS